jgi:hypothetical protein
VVVGLFFARAAGAAAVDFVVDPRALSFERELDGMGGGRTFVVDKWVTTFPVAPVSVGAATYWFRFALPEPIEFDPAVLRIDVMVALGSIESNFGIIPSAGEGATIAWDVDNVSVRSFGDRTVRYGGLGYGPVTGVGVDANQWLTDATVTPGQPFRMHSLDVTFTVSPGMLEYDVPEFPVNSVTLIVGAGIIVPAAEAVDMAPVLRAVPEPGGLAGMALLTVCGSVARRPWRRRS